MRSPLRSCALFFLHSLWCLYHFFVSNLLSKTTMNSGQRKRKGTEVSKSRSRRRRRGASSSMGTPTELIELEESSEEVVDLTCESLEPVVVDLTHNDSVVIVEEHPSPRRRRYTPRTTTQAASCILSSDDEDARDNDFSSRRSRDLLPPNHNSPRSAGSISCPICMDGYSEITQSGRLIVSTKCGHIFCRQCLLDALKNAASCPTCRKKLTHKQYHPIYI